MLHKQSPPARTKTEFKIMVKNSVKTILKTLKKRANDDWLIGYNSQELYQLTLGLYQELSQQEIPQKILLVESNTVRFFAFFLAAVAAGCPVFLCNPHWGKQEWEQVINLVQPNLIWGKINFTYQPNSQLKSINNNYQIMIPTGGSSGKIRFAIHTWETLIASVTGFTAYFGIKKVNSFCILPVYHVSGLMQFLRSFLTGGKLVIFPYKTLKNLTFPLTQEELTKITPPLSKREVNPQDFFISLVPTQLQYLLEKNTHWLSLFHTILLGGANSWQSLLNTARKAKIRLAPSYGMTETASMVVALKPEDFLTGNNSSGQVLPHAQVRINQSGIVTIKADSLCLGYYPEMNREEEFITDDLGVFDVNGYLTIIGRNSQKIITGGENVFPAEIEAVILATGLVKDVCIIGLTDAKWGQVITAVYVAKFPNISEEEINSKIEHQLSKYKLPKYWVKLEKLPRNAQGKVNYEELKKSL